MSNFVVIYPAAGEMPSDPAAVAEMMEAWNQWFASLGSALVEGGAPFGRSATLTGSGHTTDAAAHPAGGYSVLSADSLADAAQLVTGCPIHAAGGDISIFEAIEM